MWSLQLKFLLVKMSPVNTKLELELKLVFHEFNHGMVCHYMYTFCHWYKNAGDSLLNYIKITNI